MTALDQEALDWLVQFGEQARNDEQTQQLVDLVDGRINEVNAQLPGDAELDEMLHAATRAHWRSFLAMVSREVFEVHPPAEVLALSRTVARRGFGIDVVMRTYRVGQAMLWQFITDFLNKAIEDDQLRSAVLLLFWDRVLEWTDTCVEASVAVYTDEREQWQRGALARRFGLAGSLLRGDSIDIDHAETQLGHSLRRHQTAIVLWADESVTTADPVRTLEKFGNDIATLLDAPRPLMLSSGVRGMWAWIATTGVPDPSTLPTVGQPGLHAAIGSSAPDIAGFRQSHREALAAQRVALATDYVPMVIRYADVELVCLTTGDGSVEAMRVMATRELGALTSADETTARLRETLLAYLASGRNAPATAQQLNVHPNTVRYRINQSEELLGHSIEERATYIELALRCAQAYGDRILTPQPDRAIA
ncbi:PucR family transcriptional regulator [Nocardia sp. NPDC060256]|uniref:PucR family transcriptional regulator n=1 Tax=unclassified Nocardia TaxID=2637762 RepID=UPI003658508D